MKIDTTREPRAPRSYILLDIESAVLDDIAHKRYQQMERWSPAPDDSVTRRGYQRHEDPLKTPRWVFQTIVTASVMLMIEHADGNVDVASFATFSAPDHDERTIIAGVLDVLAGAPRGTELVSWGGAMHDLPVLL